MALLDDDDAFEAALSFLDEFDALHGVHESFERQQAPTLPSVPARQGSQEDKLRRRKEFNERRKMLRRTGVYGDPNRSRNERKKEIAILREQLQRLQLDLQTLQGKAAEQAGKEEEAAGQGGGEVALTPRVWREMAGRQRKRREEAESENIRLKVVVEQQQKVADSLRSLLRKRAAHLEKEYSAFTAPAFSRHYIDRVLDFRGDIGEFQGLFRHLDAARLELDTLLGANGLASMAISPVDVHIREDFGGKYMEFFTYKELPFGLQDTQEVAWDHWKGMEKHIMGNGGLYQKTAKDMDQPYTIIEDFIKELFSNSARADVQVRQVVRRYVEADRDIIVWVARLTPAEIKHKMLRGLTYNLRGQVVVKRSPHSTPDEEISVLQQCSLIYLDQGARLRYDPSSLRALTTFLTIHAAQNQRAHRELIENTLLDRSVSRANLTSKV